MFTLLLGLFLGTFVAEDLTCIAAGLAVQQGRVDAAAAVAAAALGIWVSDLAVWAAGRTLGPRVLDWPRVRRHLSVPHRRRFAQWFDRHVAAAMLGSRCVPGARLPLYLAAGATGGSFRKFTLWSAVGSAIWTPAVVLAAAGTLRGVRDLIPDGWLGGLAVSVFMLALLRLAMTLGSGNGRARARATLARVWRWEFWPMWLFYLPVAAWTAWLALKHGGYRTITAANPGIADGGLVGESKAEILARLPKEWTIPFYLATAAPVTIRVEALLAHARHQAWTFPLVLKPDTGQRGVGVRLAHAEGDVAAYLSAQPGPVLVQPYHPGPCEAGVFYFRFPGELTGRIFSITHKEFPIVIGDGASTLEELIWAHPRYRMQARVFLVRHQADRDRVLAAGERFSLGRVGNHAQGAIFRDGSHLMTAALAARIDAIARAFPGFYVGRFDLRYRDPETFRRGRDFAIVELNGATAEATDIYDPRGSLAGAYRKLFRQWSLVFAIGAANRARGVPVSSARRVFALVRAHLTTRVAFAVSD